jgi:HEAT repeat protein
LCSCCFLLFLVGCGKSTSYWTEQAKAEDPAKRLEAIHVLQEKEQEGIVVVPVLIESLQDKNTYVRRDAAKALGNFGGEAKEAVPLLLARLRDPEPSVRKAAAQSLKQIDPAAAKKAKVP